MSKMLSKADIINVNDQVVELVEVPEWGGSVLVRSISAAERGRIEADLAAYKDSHKNDAVVRMFNARLAALAICEQDGKPSFSVNDVEMLAQKSARAISRVAAVAQRLAGLTKADMDALEKNLEPAQRDGLLTD